MSTWPSPNCLIYISHDPPKEGSRSHSTWYHLTLGSGYTGPLLVDPYERTLLPHTCRFSYFLHTSLWPRPHDQSLLLANHYHLLWRHFPNMERDTPYTVAPLPNLWIPSLTPSRYLQPRHPHAAPPAGDVSIWKRTVISVHQQWQQSQYRADTTCCYKNLVPCD